MANFDQMRRRMATRARRAKLARVMRLYAFRRDRTRAEMLPKRSGRAREDN